MAFNMKAQVETLVIFVSWMGVVGAVWECYSVGFRFVWVTWLCFELHLNHLQCTMYDSFRDSVILSKLETLVIVRFNSFKYNIKQRIWMKRHFTNSCIQNMRNMLCSLKTQLFSLVISVVTSMWSVSFWFTSYVSSNTDNLSGGNLVEYYSWDRIYWQILATIFPQPQRKYYG